MDGSYACSCVGGFFGYFQRVVYLNAQVAHGGLPLVQHASGGDKDAVVAEFKVARKQTGAPKKSKPAVACAPKPLFWMPTS
jgi:hypothetical protein